MVSLFTFALEKNDKRTYCSFHGFMFNCEYSLNSFYLRKIESEEWPYEVMYPSYCNGWLYIVTPKIIKLLLKAVTTSPFLFIDDVYITGILR